MEVSSLLMLAYWMGEEAKFYIRMGSTNGLILEPVARLSWKPYCMLQWICHGLLAQSTSLWRRQVWWLFPEQWRAHIPVCGSFCFDAEFQIGCSSQELVCYMDCNDDPYCYQHLESCGVNMEWDRRGTTLCLSQWKCCRRRPTWDENGE